MVCWLRFTVSSAIEFSRGWHQLRCCSSRIPPGVAKDASSLCHPRCRALIEFRLCSFGYRWRLVPLPLLVQRLRAQTPTLLAAVGPHPVSHQGASQGSSALAETAHRPFR